MELDFSKGRGLIPTVVQDHHTGKVLMVAYVNQEALARTLATGEAHYWSRSRNTLWHKGESSGHVQRIKEVRVDCDGDTLLFKVEQVGGAACHAGYETCFYRRMDPGGDLHVVEEKIFDPEKVYGS